MSIKSSLSKTYLTNEKYVPGSNSDLQWKRNPAWLPMARLMVTDSTFNQNAITGNGFGGGTVAAIDVQSDGKVLVGGQFVIYQGISRNGLVRLNTDGSYDTSFVIGTGFSTPGVRDIKIQSDGKILVCGDFTSYQGVTSNYIIRLNSDGSKDTSFNIGTGFSGTVTCMKIQPDNKILVGGAYTQYQGVTSNYIIRLNSDGSKDTSFNIGTGFNTTVYAIELLSDGKIIVGGDFTSYQGVSSYSKIACLNSDGSPNTTFTTNSGTGFAATGPNQILSIAIQSDDKIITGGYFNSYNGTTRNNLARLNSNGTLDTSFDIGTGFDTGVWVTRFDPVTRNILAGGVFTTFKGSSKPYLIELQSNGSLSKSFKSFDFDSGVFALKINSNYGIFAGGAFTTYRGSSTNSTYFCYLTDTASNRIVILKSITPNTSVLAFTCACNTDNYIVDYGEGTITTVISGITAGTQYSYTDPDLDGTDGPVTFTDAGDLVTRNDHGYVNGDIVTFYTITSTTGISTDTPYYVINVTTNTFQISNTVNGSPVTLTTNGSGTLLPYKQALIVVYPVLTTSSFTRASLNQLSAVVSGSTVPYDSGFLDVTLSLPNLSNANDFGLSTNSLNTNVKSVGMRMLERVNFLSSSLTTLSYMFYECSALQSIKLFDTTNVTSIGSMFSGCRSLKSVPLFNTVNAVHMNFVFENCNSLKSVPLFNTTSMNAMSTTFQGCYSLESVPLFNTASVTNMAQMFNSCSALKSVPLFNTASVITMSSMFSGCYSLESVPLFNTASVTNMNFMFSNCSALKSVPLFNTASVTSMTQMFNACSSLESVPLFNTASVTDMSSMFSNCYALKSIPRFNTASVTNMSNMFYFCPLLESIPLFNTASVTNMGSMFNVCRSLKEIPSMNVSSVASFTSFLYVNSTYPSGSLSRSQMTGTKVNIDYSYQMLGATELNEIYTNLATLTMATTQTITVTGNYGTATDNPTIATNKFWTVTG